MESVLKSIDNIKSSITAIFSCDDELVKVSCKELDQLLKIKSFLYETTWEEKQKEIKYIKEKYIDSIANDIDKFNAIMFWKNTDNWSNKIDINLYKKQACSILNNIDDHNPDKRNTYNMIWQLIYDGILELSHLELKHLDLRFIQYALGKTKHHNPFKIYMTQDKNSENDDEYYIQDTKVYMNFAERFWVSVLASERNDIDNVSILTCIGTYVDPRMRYLPQSVTYFEGNVLPQIIQYFKNKDISPLIQHRRNLGILIENSTSNFYDFEEHLENGSFIAQNFTIEMPYMCYIFVDHVEIDVSSYWSNEQKDKLHVCVGNEYIFSDFVELNKRDKEQKFEVPLKTLAAKCSDYKPGYYLTVSLGFLNVHTIHAIRVFGKAISLL